MNGTKRPIEFIRRRGFDVTVVELNEVDELERTKYSEEETMQEDSYRRDAYIIKK